MIRLGSFGVTAVLGSLALGCLQGRAAERRAPDLAEISHGPHERNILDLWRAKSAKPTPLVIYIHGGGFRQGEKKSVRAELLSNCLRTGISVEAINYSLSHQAAFPAPMQDGVRAV